jgi:hypothetical protein
MQLKLAATPLPLHGLNGNAEDRDSVKLVVGPEAVSNNSGGLNRSVQHTQEI